MGLRSKELLDSGAPFDEISILRIRRLRSSLFMETSN
jgi:hypothetical protein